MLKQYDELLIFFISEDIVKSKHQLDCYSFDELKKDNFVFSIKNSLKHDTKWHKFRKHY